MNDAPYWHWLCHIESVLKADASFAGDGEQPGIDPCNIVIRDAPLQEREKDQEQFRDEITPGLIVTPAGSISRPSGSGTNRMDDVSYPVLVQLIDRYDGRFSRDQTRCHLRWCTLISRALHSAPLDRHKWGDSYPIISWTEETKVVDESVYWRHELFVRGVLVHAVIREPRGL